MQRVLVVSVFAFSLLVLGVPANASSVAVSQVAGLVHDSNGLLATLDSATPESFFTFDADNFGTFGWNLYQQHWLQSVRRSHFGFPGRGY